jgi:hypothetical protein
LVQLRLAQNELEGQQQLQSDAGELGVRQLPRHASVTRRERLWT